MPIFFHFAADDPIVTGYLPENLVTNVTSWQIRDEYDFEFHNGHLTGFPVYIRPVTKRTLTSNIAKFDTLNKSASDYATIDSFANEGMLKELGAPIQTEILRLVRDNWNAFSQLALNYYNGRPAVPDLTPEEIEQRNWVDQETRESSPIEVKNLNAFRHAWYLDTNRR